MRRASLPLGRASLVKFGLIFSLYGAQGIANGFLIVGLPSVLRKEGLPLGRLWVAFVAPIFFSIKFLWAPLADRYWISALGRRRTWLVPATLAAGAALLVVARFPPSRGLGVLIPGLLLIGLAAANMNVATGAYAVELLAPAERGIGNGLQSAGLATGALIGDGVMLLLVDRFGWTTALTTIGLLIPVIAAPGLLRREPPVPVEASVSKAGRASLATFFRRPEAPLALLLALMTGLCYYLIGPILGPFLVDRGLSLSQIGFVSMAGTVAGVAGALLGGASVNHLGFRRAYAAILIGGLVFALVAATLALLDVRAVPILAMAVAGDRLLLGAVFAVFYANVMNWCSRSQAATDYTMMASVFAAMAVLGGSLAGISADRLGYTAHFLIVAGFHGVTLGALAFLHPRITAGVSRALGVPAEELVGVPREAGAQGRK